MTPRPLYAVLASALALGCASRPVTPAPTTTAVELGNADADQAIATVRAGVEAVGGLQRWRLSEGKFTIDANAVAGSRKLAVRTVWASDVQMRFEYTDDRVTYVLEGDECRRLVYGVQTDCSPEEAQWALPLRVINVLVFPSADIAGLGASLRTRPAAGPGLTTVGIRPAGTKLKLLASYGADQRLTSVALTTKRSDGVATEWRFDFSDYRDVDGLLIPHRRIITKDAEIIWTETIQAVSPGQANARLFLPPMPALMDRMFVGELPQREVRVEPAGSMEIETLSLPLIPGGAMNPPVATAERPAQRVLRLFHKGPLSELEAATTTLETQAKAQKTKILGKPAVMQLDHRAPTAGSGLYMVYLRADKSN